VSWFAYVGQNPLRYIDPSGLRRVDGDTTISGEQNIVDNIGFQWSNRGGSKERFVLTVGGSLHFIFDIPEDQSFIAATFRGLLTRSDGQQREIEIGVVAVDE
jgi:hypothetical protein